MRENSQYRAQELETRAIQIPATISSKTSFDYRHLTLWSTQPEEAQDHSNRSDFINTSLPASNSRDAEKPGRESCKVEDENEGVCRPNVRCKRVPNLAQRYSFDQTVKDQQAKHSVQPSASHS